jgi:hypothetical protein
MEKDSFSLRLEQTAAGGGALIPASQELESYVKKRGFENLFAAAIAPVKKTENEDSAD